MAASDITLTDYQALALGVGTIESGNHLASEHLLWGEAMAVANPPDSGATVVAALSWGLGRVVHFGHEAMLSYALAEQGLGRLLRNAASWSAGGKATVRVAGATSDATDGLVKRLVAAFPQQYELVGTVSPAKASAANIDLYIIMCVASQQWACPALPCCRRPPAVAAHRLLACSQLRLTAACPAATAPLPVAAATTAPSATAHGTCATRLPRAWASWLARRRGARPTSGSTRTIAC